MRDDDLPISYAGPAWFVIVTNIGCQVRAQLGLEASGYRTFLAHKTVWVSHARIRKMKRKPLLDRYLFVEIDPNRQSFEAVRQTNGVESILTDRGYPAIVPRAWVEELLLRQLRGEFDFASKEQLPPNAMVEIIEGIHDSLRGVLMSIGRKGASVKLFNKKSPVLVSAVSLRPALC